MADTLKPNTDSPHGETENLVAKQNKPGNRNDEIEARTITNLESPGSPQIDASPNEAEKNPRKWWEWIRTNVSVLISVVAVCFAFGSCYGSNRSASIAEEALKTNIDNARLDQRPWIGPAWRGLARDPTNGKIVGIHWKYINGGKSPALNVRFNLNLMIGAPLEGQPSAIHAPIVERCEDPQPLTKREEGGP